MPRLSLPVDDTLNAELKRAAQEDGNRSVVSLILSILQDWYKRRQAGKKRA